MKLPTGATGFGRSLSDKTLQDDLRTFAALSHHAAQRTRGTVTALAPAGMTPNFHTATIIYSGRAVAVLRHALCPLLTVAKPTPLGESPRDWIDLNDLTTAIREASDLRILTCDDLLQPLVGSPRLRRAMSPENLICA